MDNADAEMILYVGNLGEQYQRMCSRLENLHHPIVYTADLNQARRLVMQIKPVIVAIGHQMLPQGEISRELDSLIQHCKYNRTDVISLKDEGLSVVFSRQLSRPSFVITS